MIGPEESQHTFIIHPDLMWHFTNYFKGILKTHAGGRGFKEEGRLEIVRLLDGSEFEDDKEIFSLFLWILYKDKFDIKDLWYDLDPAQAPENELRDETYLRLRRLYLLADYFEYGFTLNLLYNKLLEPDDATADWEES